MAEPRLAQLGRRHVPRARGICKSQDRIQDLVAVTNTADQKNASVGILDERGAGNGI